MIFKNFRFQVVLRVLILTTGITLFAWCILNGFYLRCVYVGLFSILATIELIWYTERINRDIKTFLQTLIQRDFTTHYEKTGKGQSFEDLYGLFNGISELFKKISVEKEIQYKYLELLVEHVQVSILSIDADEKVHLANQALRNLLRRNVLVSLKTLESVDETLVKVIREIHAGETRLVKVNIERELFQLSVHASEFKLDGRYFKLISMQNIKNELDAREMESWQKLIRVLSHEIMNSASPISSLSDTLHKMVKSNQPKFVDLEPSLYESLDKGLEAIRIRSEGLFNFTQTYRKLTQVPNVAPVRTNLKNIIDRVTILMESKIANNKVTMKVSDVDTELVADPELMEHVFINLLLNAVDALKKTHEPHIQIFTTKDQKGLLQIHVLDNGEGMDERTIEKIFIPFFTTRSNGSGIGLALTRQILQLHGADISLKSEVGKGTEFVITV